ncbi:hypothetical protein A5640_04235 [Mycobacterium asiaticum]|uniref:Uncharacterized protein n=1 Tax=Mycobacterium asiaticum TaxID=1790 RepID=A0A1A3KWC2_MYCAS|nr:hypothetical protein A5640_04235 [Mycobacterium asiaticum]
MANWATPSATEAAATPAIIRSFDEATGTGLTLLALLAATANVLGAIRFSAIVAVLIDRRLTK